MSATQRIRISFIDQLPASHVLRVVHTVQELKLPIVYHLVSPMLQKTAQFKVALKR